MTRKEADPGSAWLQPVPCCFMVKNYGILGREKQRLMRPDESSQPPTMTQERAAGESQSRALTLVDDKGRQVLVPPAVLRVGGAAPSLVDHAGDARALEVRGLG